MLRNRYCRTVTSSRSSGHLDVSASDADELTQRGVALLQGELTAGSEVRLVKPLTGGRSGARVWLCDVDAPPSDPSLDGQYVLKISSGGDVTTNLASALASELGEFAKNRVPALRRSASGDGIVVELYDLAGHSLDTVRTAESVSDHLDRDETLRTLASDLLRAQLVTSIATYPSSVALALESWLGADWSSGNRGDRLRSVSTEVNTSQEQLFSLTGELLPDPMLLVHEILEWPLDGTIDGISHGDLHERNILVRGSRQTADLAYWLIDFNWDKRAPLLYDQAYLECSAVLNGLEGTSFPALSTVLARIDRVEPAAPAPLDLAGGVLVNRIQSIRDETERELRAEAGRRYDIWRRQSVLARVAAALNWSAKPGLEPERSRIAYLMAAWNLRIWMRTFSPETWRKVNASPSRVAAETVNVLPEAEILRLWSTFKLKNGDRDLFLISGTIPSRVNVSPIAQCDWSAVIDLDPLSDMSGVAATVINPLKSRRHVSVFGMNPVVTEPQRATNWLMANGWDSHGEATSSSPQDWRRGHFRRVREVVDVVRAASRAGSAAVLILQSDATDSTYDRILEYIDEVYQSAPDVVRLDASARSTEGIDAAPFLQVVRTSILQSTSGGAPSLPGAKGPVQLSRADLLRLEVDLEVLHSDVVNEQGEISASDDAFWRGRPPTWGELDARIDLERDAFPALRGEILEALDPPRLAQIPIYHSPGAGGTTLGRRLAWDLHLSYPTVRLRAYTNLTAERIDEISRLSGKPVVVLAEASDLQPSDQDDLFEKLRLRGTAAAVVVITRSANGAGARKHLMDPMPLSESVRFIDAHLARGLPPEAIKRLLQLRGELSDSSPSQYRSPFYIGLCAYDDEFQAVDRYVDHHLAGAPLAAKKVANYIALVTRYGQFAVPPAVIQRWLGESPRRQADVGGTIADLLGPDLRHLVVVANGGVRLLHPLIGERVLTSREGGAQLGLAQISVSFIRDLRSALGATSNVARKMLADLFVRRAPFSGRDRKDSFAEVVQSMSLEGGQLVFETLTDIYPSEPHFWNHRGRYHIYVVKGDFEQAESHLDKAVECAGADSSMHQHTLGMVRRFWVESEVRDALKSSGEPIGAEGLLDHIEMLFDRASEAFSRSRTGMSTDHGLVTPLQLISYVIDALVRASGQPNLTSLLETNTRVANWVATQIGEAEALLDDLRAAVLNGTSRNRFYDRLTQQFDLLYGDIDMLVAQWRDLRSAREEESSVLGPALARTVFAQAGRDWSEFSESSAREIHEMLWGAVEAGSGSDSDLRLWFQAFRRLPEYSETTALERLSSAAERGSLEAYYYLYVISFMRWLRGDAQNQDRTRQFLEECQRLARNKNRSWSFEWVGEGDGVPPLVHFSELGPRPIGSDGFFPRSFLLRRVSGVVERIDGRQAGRIRVLPGTLTAHFVPRSKFLQSRDVNASVDFFLGFTYDGLRAWEVEYSGVYRAAEEPSMVVPSSSLGKEEDVIGTGIVESAGNGLAETANGGTVRATELRTVVMGVTDAQLDLESCRLAMAGAAGDDGCKRAIEELIKQCKRMGAQLDALRLGTALSAVLGPAEYSRLKNGGKLRSLVERLGFETDGVTGGFLITSKAAS